MSENTRCPVTRPKLLAFCRRRCRRRERYRSEILASANRCRFSGGTSGLRIAVPRLSGKLSVLARYYSISSSASGDPARCSITVAWSQCCEFGTRRLQRHLLELLASAVPARDPATVLRNQAGFRLPDEASVPIIMIDGDGPGAVPRLPAGARPRKAMARHSAGDLFFGCVIPIRIISMRRTKAFAADGITNCIPRSRPRRRPKT